MTGWRRTLAIAVLAVGGLVLAAGLTTAASTLSGQSVGLSAEPLSAGESLAPSETATPSPSPRPTRTATPRPTPHPHATPDLDAGADPHGGPDRRRQLRRPRRRRRRRLRRGRGRGRGAATTTSATVELVNSWLTNSTLAQALPKLSLALPGAWGPGSDAVGMSLRTPLVIAVAVLSALGGVALAAVAMPSASPRTVAAAATPLRHP